MAVEFARGRAAMAQELVDLLETSQQAEADVLAKLTTPPKNYEL